MAALVENVLPRTGTEPVRYGWRAVLFRFAVPLAALLQGLRLGNATRGLPLAVVIVGEWVFFAALLLLLHVGGRRRGGRAVVTGRVLLVIGCFVCLLSVAVVAGRTLPAGASDRSGRSIPGAPGYTTYYGEHGEPIAVGHPWGTPCQPVRFDVADGVAPDLRAQISAVVSETRRNGINVTLNDGSIGLPTAPVYDPPGVMRYDLVDVWVATDEAPASRLPDGRPEQLRGTYGSRRAGAGREIFSGMHGTIHLATVGADPMLQRVAMRELVAMSQGVDSGPRGRTGMRTGTTLDSFSTEDVAAMRLMSGCGTQASAFLNTAAQR